jgi:putative transposase
MNNSLHPFYQYDNLVKELSLTRPNQVWVSDMTYIRTGNGFSYLSLITDAYSPKMAGGAVEKTLHTQGPLTALQMAARTLTKGKESLIHHSDRVCSTAVRNISSYSPPIIFKSV